jgi:uncharacterized membrane protein
LNHSPEILLFAGRLHPLLVHLPIGMMVALAALELAALLPRYKNANASAGFILALAAPLAVVTALCGWLLSQEGGYDETLLAWHQWLGIATAAGCVVTAMLFCSGKSAVYRASLLVTVTVLMAAGHLGGSLTHGSDFLTRYAPWPLNKLLGVASVETIPPAMVVKDPSLLPIFAGVIQPVLAANCTVCHGAKKSKGKLRLDSLAALLKGSEDGVVIKPGDAEQSPLVQRLLLPLASDDHMPPEGKKQPTADEIALLKWWVEADAPETQTVTELKPSADILKIITARFDIKATRP